MANARQSRMVVLGALGSALIAASMSANGAEGRRIEEVVITAERQESTISDTSISISAFTGETLQNLGIRNAEDLQNMIPAAVIQPYDMAVRGVGRNFRNLGGDPGIATYQNGVYSEDFGIASSEGGLFDIERVEVLRGPQGTLYGRNAIGGAVNFINSRPTEEFEGLARVIAGNNGLREMYGMLSGGIIEGLVSARVTAVNRERDGYIDDLGGGEDVDDFDDENYTLALLITPFDGFSWYIRGNERSLGRRMGGADSAGVIQFAENGGQRTRDTSTYVFGYRAVDPNVPCADAVTRTATVARAGVRGGIGCTVPGLPTFSFTSPFDGTTVNAQRPVPGVDFQRGSGTSNLPNLAYGADPAHQRLLGFDDLEGNDLKTATNGLNHEGFDHQAGTSEMNYIVSETVSVKYIFGYSDFFYDRTSDTDLTDSQVFDRQFYVSQEAEYASHELQLFWDPTPELSVTTGLFVYKGLITQRGNFHNSLCEVGQPCASRYQNPAFGTQAAPRTYTDVTPAVGFLDFAPMQTLFSAKETGLAVLGGAAQPFWCAGPIFSSKGFDPVRSNFCFGKWSGTDGFHVDHEDPTAAVDLQYQTRSERDAYAAYTQAEYHFNDQFALTLGLRWAKDELFGEENLFFYSEDTIGPLGFGAAGGTSSLAELNQRLGYLSADGRTILDPQRLLVNGVPTSLSLWRQLKREDDAVTWRVNLDWTPNDDHLVYLSATRGNRAGGFNLVFFSARDNFEPETLTAYELGYKGTLMDGTMQVNAAAYYYDYEDIETFGNGPSAFNPDALSTSVFSVPEAHMIGLDIDLDWLATDQLTLSANFSFTHSEYDSDIAVNDSADPTRPPSLFDARNVPIQLKGKQLLQVPEMKYGGQAQYSFDLAERGSVVLIANYSWISKVYYTAFESKDSAAPSYGRTDVRAIWESPSKELKVAAYVNNVFDQIGLRQVDHYSGGEAVNFRRIGANTNPRQFGMELSYSF